MLKFKRKTKWSDTEDVYMEKTYPTESVEDIARELGRTPSAIISRAAKLGLRKEGRHQSNNKGWEDGDEKIIIDNYPNLSIKELAKKLDRTENAISYRLYALGLKGNNVDEEYLKRNYPRRRSLGDIPKRSEGSEIIKKEEKKPKKEIAIRTLSAIDYFNHKPSGSARLEGVSLVGYFEDGESLVFEKEGHKIVISVKFLNETLKSLKGLLDRRDEVANMTKKMLEDLGRKSYTPVKEVEETSNYLQKESKDDVEDKSKENKFVPTLPWYKKITNKST